MEVVLNCTKISIDLNLLFCFQIIPARDNAQNHRTLAQKKEYDAPLEERGTKKKGRSVEKKGKRAPRESSSRTPTPDLPKKPKESWVTGAPSNVQKPPLQLSSLPPGIVVGRSTEEGQSSPQHQVQERIANLGGISLTPSRSNGEESRSPLLPTLPPGMSISREALPPKLPPGVSLQPSPLPKLPPGISIETETNSPVPRLPPGISMEKAKEEEKEESPRESYGEEVSRDEEQSSEEESRTRSPRRAKASISYQEPPLNKKMRQGDNSQTLVGGKTLPGVSIEKSREDTLRLNLPPGMMISKSVNEVPQFPAPGSSGDVDHKEESSDEDSHTDEANNGPAKKRISLKKKRGTPGGSPDKFVPPPEDERPPPQQERIKSPEPKEPRAARGRSELARAKIRATLREDSLSDEELAGARVPYRGRWKDDGGVKTKVTPQPVQADVDTAPSSKINRKAWQALGGEPSEERNLGKDIKMPDESNGNESLTNEVSEKDNHCEKKIEDDGYETVVIKPKKRGRKSKETREPSPAPESPAPIDDLLEDDEEVPKTKTQTSRQERLMEDLFDETENPPKKVTKGGKKRRGKKESTDSEEPLSQRMSGRRRSGRSEGSIEEPSSLPHSPERNKPMAVIEPDRTDFEEVSNVF